MSETQGLAVLAALVVTQLEALAATLRAADDSGDDFLHVDVLRHGRERVCDALMALERASLTPGSQELPGRWPEPWDDANSRRPSALADRIARGEGTADQIRALAAGYRVWTRNYCDSFVDTLMLELVETDRGVRDQVTLAFTRVGEDACVALCAEVRDIEDDGGLWIVETRRRRTKGGVWFALLKARYPEATRAQRAAPALPPESTSTVRPGARGASLGAPEVIVLRRRRGAL